MYIMSLLSDARMNNYRFITEYLNSLSELERRNFEEGEFHIDSHHSFYVKNNIVFNETVIHSELTAFAISENFGGILLLFGWSNSNTVKDGHETYNLFMELSEGVIHNAKSKIHVIDSLLWMHEHDYVHLDIYNNNIFKLGDVAVIGDFDRSAHSSDIFIKFQDLSHFYAWLPKVKINLFKHLLVTILNGGRQVQYIKCEDKLLGILATNIETERRFKEKFKDPASQIEADANIATYEKILTECNTILESPRLIAKLYEEFKNAMIDISLLDKMPSVQKRKTTKSSYTRKSSMSSRKSKSKSHKRRTI